DRRYLHTFGANASFTVEHVRRDWVAGLQVFYLGGFLLLPAFRTDAFLDLLRFCRASGVTTVLDVVTPRQVQNMADLAPLLPYVDYLLPNDDEARVLTGQAAPEDQLRAFLDAGAGTAVITCGARGALAARAGEAWRAAAYPVPVVDPSGSGDAFTSGLVAGVLQGWDLPRALRWASALGASAVRAVGTTPGVFSAAEAEEFVATHPLAVDPLSL
ncbi:MAG: carbohydrate kinase family protein, partial [Gemmatimonadota bacterium]